MTFRLVSSIYIALKPKSVHCVLAIYPVMSASIVVRLTPSDWSLSTVCWSYLGDNHQYSHLLYIKTPVLARHDSRHAVCLHSHQTRVYLLCTGSLGSLSTTFGIIVHLCSPLTGVCPLHAKVLSWLQPSGSPSVASQKSSLCPAWLSTLPYVFTALRSESVHCVLGLIFFLARPSV